MTVLLPATGLTRRYGALTAVDGVDLALAPGARHALAAAVFELGAAGRLVAAVAEQCAVLYALAATPQDLQESVGGGSPRHSLWKTVVARVVGLDPKHPDTPLATNLFVGLFAAGEIQSETDLDLAWQSWREARKKIRGFHV